MTVTREPDARTAAEWREEIARRIPSDPSLVIPALQFVHDAAGYLPGAAVQATAEHLRVSPSRVFGVASFYSQFHFEPRGAHTITVCRGTACHVRGSASVLGELEEHLGIPAGGTTPDLQHTLETVACFGSCALAPVVVSDGRVHGRQTGATARALVDAASGPARVRRTPAPSAAPPDEAPGGPSAMPKARTAAGLVDLDTRIGAAREAWRGLQDGGELVIFLWTATCGLAAGAGDIVEALPGELARLGVSARLVTVGCVGMCFAEPLLEIAAPGLPRVTYQRVTPATLAEILEAHLGRGNPPAAHALGTAGDGAVADIPRLADLPMLRPQVRIALRNCGVIDPTSVDHYLARDGYAGLRRALAMPPEEVVGEVKASGLRGRGGGGFPTGAKWEFCRAGTGTPKFVICNADEGDPGAFMDRSVLEGDPHAVLEGLCIAAYAIGASRGYVYIRAEYPLAIARLEVALGQMRELGLLGSDILGSGFSFEVDVKQGAGAFVCGEETALMASIEGRRGMPRPRPPFPAVKGLFGQPSNINNVETLANVANILREGASWFASFGTGTSKGTKTFALTGKVNRPGLIEVPMGITLGEVVEEIGGGIAGGGRFKAAQTGGPSGGCLPIQLLDLPIDYEHLKEAGSIMGSGGLVIMDEGTCMVDLARYFLTFTQSESCGQCTPCREGTGRMLEILERICRGAGRPEDIPLLERLGRAVRDTSLCGLGQTAPNPVLTTLRYFRAEYEEHIEQKLCRAGRCPGLVVAPCTHLCPAGVEAHRYVRLASQGRFEDAYLVVREKLPLPSVCGAVCFHPCERGCRRGDLDEHVAIRALKGSAVKFGSQAEGRIPIPARPLSGKSVAVIGSGPAGLTAAYYLARVGGHTVTIYEALERPGGMLRYGIPRYRLPADALERDLRIIETAGVRIETNAEVRSLAALREQGHDAVFVSTGAHISDSFGDDPQDLEGVVDCIHFLRDVAAGTPVRVGRQVAVVGGGNSAVDAARTALRIGAEEVTIVYRRDRSEMPADDHEIREALAEGVRLQVLVAPVSVHCADDGLDLTCHRMRLGAIDASGRRRPESIAGSEFTTRYHTVLSAVGQHPHVPPEWGLEAGRGERVVVAPGSHRTSLEGVFAGGDAVTGPASVITAIAEGRAAAQEIDRYLGGSGQIDERLVPPEGPADIPLVQVEAGQRFRTRIPSTDARARVHSFAEVELGYSREDAMAEASRCLHCDLLQTRG
jgi:NADH-quinone oxidoreductase subunit F